MILYVHIKRKHYIIYSLYVCSQYECNSIYNLLHILYINKDIQRSCIFKKIKTFTYIIITQFSKLGNNPIQNHNLIHKANPISQIVLKCLYIKIERYYSQI